MTKIVNVEKKKTPSKKYKDLLPGTFFVIKNKIYDDLLCVKCFAHSASTKMPVGAAYSFNENCCIGINADEMVRLVDIIEIHWAHQSSGEMPSSEK